MLLNDKLTNNNVCVNGFSHVVRAKWKEGKWDLKETQRGGGGECRLGFLIMTWGN